VAARVRIWLTVNPGAGIGDAEDWGFYLAFEAEGEPGQHLPPPHGFMRAPWRGDFPPVRVR